MGKQSVLATGGVIASVGVSAALVISVATAQPRSSVGDSLPPLPASSTGAVSETSAAPASPSPATGVPVTKSRITTTRAALSATRPRTTHPLARVHPVQPPPASTKPPAVTKPLVPSGPAPKPAPAPVRGQPLPLGYATGTASRVITVVASWTGSTTATVQAWDRAPGGGWLKHGAAIPAHVGSQGLTTHPSESLSATPIGSFTLTQAFGRAANPGTELPYFQTGWTDWWVSDTGSALYNTHQRCGTCGFDTGVSENLYGAGYVYTYAVVIDYNRFPVVRGAGSAFFLHVTDGSATAGCVAIPEGSLVPIMRWLMPSAHPRVLIGVA
jgi:L,D-peptidoglycan transpeptidase YkuD (ErfK/YbiS/YcfS/YnhG family)